MKEDKVIQDWLEKELPADEKRQMEDFLAFTEKLSIPENKSKAEAWNSILTQIEETSSVHSRIILHESHKKRNLWLWVASAAAVFMIAYFSFFQQESITTYQSAAGQILSFNLPDQSKVYLNAGSSVSFKEKNWSNDRKLTLSGEAFFDVIPGNEFSVVGENGEVKVLGTSFNVFERSNNLKVSVFTGKVAVSSGEQKVTLSIGEEAELLDGELVTSNFNLNQTATWRTGSFYFDAEPLNSVIEELERQFDIKITVQADISERYYSGYFSKANLTEALQLVFVPMGLSIESKGKQVTIK